jgi:oligosaccharide repeat unit polymerase
MLIGYVGGPVKAFELLLRGGYPGEAQGLYTFDWLNSLLYRLGFSSSYSGVVREYVFTPVVTNVYTFLDCYVLDFGLFGALAGPIGLGLILGATERFARRMPYATLLVSCASVGWIADAPLNNEFIRFNVLLTVVFGILADMLIRLTWEPSAGAKNTLEVPGAGLRGQHAVNREGLPGHVTFKMLRMGLAQWRAQL